MFFLYFSKAAVIHIAPSHARLYNVHEPAAVHLDTLLDTLLDILLDTLCICPDN